MCRNAVGEMRRRHEPVLWKPEWHETFGWCFLRRSSMICVLAVVESTIPHAESPSDVLLAGGVRRHTYVGRSPLHFDTSRNSQICFLCLAHTNFGQDRRRPSSNPPRREWWSFGIGPRLRADRQMPMFCRYHSRRSVCVWLHERSQLARSL